MMARVPALLATFILCACGGVVEPGGKVRNLPNTSIRGAAGGALGGYDVAGRWIDPGVPGAVATVARFEVWVGEVATRVSTTPEPATSSGGSGPGVQMDNGPERLTLVLGLGTDSRVVGGTATWGVGTPLPVATDPNQPYPAGAATPEQLAQAPCRGMPYPLHDTTDTGALVSTSFDPSDLWDDWCALQRSYAVGGGKFACAADRRDPFKLAACSGADTERVCGCDAVGCTTRSTNPLFIDLARAGDRASGQLDGFDEFYTFWLTRVNQEPPGPASR